MGSRALGVLLAACVALAACGGSSGEDQATRTVLDPAIAPVSRPHVPSGPRTAPVMILMYHVIATARPGTPYPELWVPEARFRQEMTALARAGYHATTLDRVWRAWHGHGPMPMHPLVVSFDDGYLSHFTRARPDLARLGWPGVLNLEVHNVGPGGLTRRQIRSLLADGWEVDAHTMTHPDLTTVDAARLRHEVAGSRAWIRHAFGIPVDFFCYPAGRYDATVEAAVHAAGYLGATTTDPGRASRHGDPYTLPRLRVTPAMTAADVVARVRAA